MAYKVVQQNITSMRKPKQTLMSLFAIKKLINKSFHEYNSINVFMLNKEKNEVL